MTPSEDVEVVEDLRRNVGDHVIRVRVLAVPVSEQYPEDVKYAFHYGRKGGDDPVLRYDNHHGVHKRHEEETVEEIDIPGTKALFERFKRELPDGLL